MKGRAKRKGEKEREQGGKRTSAVQGVPPGVGTGTVTRMGMGRQHSRSAGESVRPYPRPHLQPHQQQDTRLGFESVYPGVWMRAGVGGAAGEEHSMGLGRQRSVSAGEGVHS
jgi:hypothetical protein